MKSCNQIKSDLLICLHSQTSSCKISDISIHGHSKHEEGVCNPLVSPYREWCVHKAVCPELILHIP